MHDIHVGVVYELTEIVVGLHCLAEALLGGSHCRVEVILVHIAQGHHAAALVALEVELATAYATHTYDASCELVTRSHIVVGSPHLAQHLAGKDGEECRRGCCSLQETSSVYSHVVLGLYMLLLCIAICEPVRLLSACRAVGCGFGSLYRLPFRTLLAAACYSRAHILSSKLLI